MSLKFNPLVHSGLDNVGSGSGDVTGPSSSVDNDIAVFDGTTGKLIKDGGKTIAQIEAEIPSDTDDLPEGTTNLYYKDSRVSSNPDVLANTSARHTHANKSILDATEESFTTVLKGNYDDAYSHSQLTSGNPHQVTLADVGGTTDHTQLSNIGTNTHAQIDDHIASTSNPHSVTASQVGAYSTSETDNLLSSKEDVINKVASFQTTPDDTHYPSEKLVKDSLDGKSNVGHTHVSSDITDFQTAVSNNSDVSANTSARHSALTLGTNTASALSISGQELSLLDKFVQNTGDTITPLTDSTSIFNITDSLGTSIFNVDSTNGRVGIGTTSPSYKLDVSGTARIAGNKSIGLYLAPVPAEDPSATNYVGLSESITVGAGWANDVTVPVYGSWLNAGTSSSYAGNILSIYGLKGVINHYGSGTVNSASGLSFQINNRGSGNITSAITLNIQPTNNLGTGSVVNAYGIYISNINVGTSLNYAIYTNLGKVRFGDDAYIIGSVGIGTTAPTSKLDVNDDRIRIEQSFTPTSTTDTSGNVGDIAWDDNYFYIKTSLGWKRAALATF